MSIQAQIMLRFEGKNAHCGPGWVRTIDQAVMSRALCH